MTEFIRAEWKTLIVLLLAAAGIFYVVMRETPVQIPPGDDAWIKPGTSIGPVELGQSRASVIDTLGAPVRTETHELALESLHYDDPPLDVFVHDGRVTAIEVSVPKLSEHPEIQATLPGGLRVSSDWTSLGKAIKSRMTVVIGGAPRGAWQRYDGIAAYIERDDETEDPRLRSLTVVESTPRALRLQQ